MGIKNDIKELQDAKVINSEIADNIKSYYAAKSGNNENRLFLIFGTIGAVLVGLGLILIMAHNWDQMGRWLKILIAFSPLIIGQGLCAYSYLKKKSIAWEEASAVFLFLSIGGCISLISQIYHLPGEMSSFIFVWLILALPIIYLMPSSIVSVLYIIGATILSVQTGTWEYNSHDRYKFYVLLITIIPFYLYLAKYKQSNYLTTLHHWIVPVTLSIALLTSSIATSGFVTVVFVCLFGVFYMIGHLDFFYKNKLRNNSYLVLGSLASVVLLFVSSFSEFWKYVVNSNHIFSKDSFHFYTLMGIAIIFLAVVLLSHMMNKFSFKNYKLLFFGFIIYIILYILRWDIFYQGIIINALLFLIGITTIYEGIQRDHIGILNYGLLITAMWIMVRFLNFDVTFIVRGLILVGLGIGFFMANYYLLKKRKSYAK